MASLSSGQSCCSDNASDVAAVATTTCLNSTSSHTFFSLSMPYLSAATSRYCAITAAASSPSSSISGSSSTKCRNAANASASMSSTRTMALAARSRMEPNSSARNTGDRAARMHRCAANASPSTLNLTSAAASEARRSPRWRCRRGGGTAGTVTAAASSTSTRMSGTLKVRSHRTAKESPPPPPSSRCPESSRSTLLMKLLMAQRSCPS
uniref:Uncharacterized protein n=1 Tax=Oryza nivara TaxID=4536 RepID=A0A0E0J4J3_ORYNI